MTIRDLDDEVRDRLRVRAAQNGRSMEAEVRAILKEAVSPVEEGLIQVLLDLGQAIDESGYELVIPPRTTLSRDPFE